jgi:hypothetical protein
LREFDDSSFVFIVAGEGGTRFGVVAHGKRQNPANSIECAQWNEAGRIWREIPMRLGFSARIKNRLFNAGWVQQSCLGAHPAPGGFSFDYMMSIWDEPSHIWRATYSTARQCFDLTKLPFNPYDTSLKKS